MHIPYLGRSKEGVRSPPSEVVSSCELPGGCWEPNLAPLEEQQMFLTTEPSSQPLDRILCTPHLMGLPTKPMLLLGRLKCYYG